MSYLGSVTQKSLDGFQSPNGAGEVFSINNPRRKVNALGQILLCVLVIAFTLMIAAFIAGKRGARNFTDNLIYPLVIVGIIGVAVFTLIRAAQALAFELPGKRELVIDSRGITYQDSKAPWKIDWSEVEQVWVSRGWAFSSNADYDELGYEPRLVFQPRKDLGDFWSRHSTMDGFFSPRDSVVVASFNDLEGPMASRLAASLYRWVPQKFAGIIDESENSRHGESGLQRARNLGLTSQNGQRPRADFDAIVGENYWRKNHYFEVHNLEKRIERATL